MLNIYVVWYLFLAGTGAGCYALASVWAVAGACGWRGPASGAALNMRFGFAVAPMLLVIASLFLLVDLGSPERAWLVFLHPFDSAVSSGAWCVACLALISMGMLAASVSARVEPRRFLWFCWIVGLPLSLGVMSYAGVLLSSMVSVDFWYTALVPVLFVISSLATGFAAIEALSVMMGGVPLGPRRGVRAFTVACSLLEAGVLAAYLIDRMWFSLVSQMSCASVLTGELAFPFWFGVVFLGLVLPLLMQAIGSRRSLPGCALASALGVLVGGFSLRYCIVFAAVLPTAALGSFP